MKLTKTCAKFLRKHGGTILAVAASVGVVATAIETGRATTKAQHILEVDKELTKFNEDEFGVTEEPPTKKQIVLMCWKAYPLGLHDRDVGGADLCAVQPDHQRAHGLLW